ncbi:endonuclease/exonuclease/phosphatase family protein [Nocardioides panacihumi]|uniref:Endonuclease/exonuclease/phosphatase family protein n=1 Tax=Nocardioides panacihumi TaxID=400774 RepID=A0ABN2R1D9_9ACTN
MRVVTFNILNGRSPDRHEVDIASFAAAVNSLDADVLALQEVDRFQPRSGRADLTAVAAEATGAEEHLFVASLAGTPGATWTAATGEEQPDSAAYGIALLSRYPVSAWETVRLPAVPVPAPVRHPGRRLPSVVRDEPRVAVAAVVDTPLGSMTIANTHLSYVRWWNGRQLRLLTRSLAHLPRPLLLTGDLNMGPDRAALATGLTSIADHLTFPWDTPSVQLDHILADPPLRARSSVRRLPVSDHLALVADIDG